MNASVFSGKVVEWYLEHRRPLPWRKTRDPYKIWISEIILQQTRVAQGLPYYRLFIRKYPTVQSLAKASEQDVLRLWQGLGYYSRARNLHACAKQVTYRLGGKFPGVFSELKKLPGVGNYTAAAIASLAFDEPVAVVDGNVYRVLARIFGLMEDITSPAGQVRFQELANRLIPKDNPAVFNQAVMEFGALHCTPMNPNCVDCPFKLVCKACRQDLQEFLPVKRKKKKAERRNLYYFVIRRGNKWLMRKRSGDDIWKGLWDFPMYEGKANLGLKELSGLIGSLGRNKISLSPVLRQLLTHQVIYARFVEIDWPARMKLPSHKLFSEAKLLTPRRIVKVPKPVLVSRFLEQCGL